MITEPRLSEAIRAGAKLHPQCFGKLFLADRHPIGEQPWRIGGQIVATCALGAASEALGEDLLQLQEDNLHLHYPWGTDYVNCPTCTAAHAGPVFSIIAHLNDFHKWTREQIADWIESIDPTEPREPREIDQHDPQRASSEAQDQAVRPEDSLDLVEV